MTRLIALLLVLPTLAIAESADLDTALRYHQYRDYDTAFRLFMELAEQGDAAAQANVGYYYDEGLAVARDTGEAVRWYQLAAENGDVTAQYNLGVMYEAGEGVEQDYTEAFKWFRMAADNGDSHACIYVGLFYEEGLGRAPDPVSAYTWYHVAAQRQNPSGLEKRSAIGSRLTQEEVGRAIAEGEAILEELNRRRPMKRPSERGA